MNDSHKGAAPVVLDLKRRLEKRLRDAIPRGRPVALLDFPNHDNIGDTLLWHATRAYLQQAGAEVRYACDHTGFSPRLLRRRLGREGIVLLHGGGNFGDLWPTFHEFRKRAIAELRDLPIVQLPQSIHFRSPENLVATRRVVDAHPELTIFVRDEPSLAIASAEFGAKVELAPDMAFALGPLEAVPSAPGRRPLWVARTDAETTGAQLPEHADAFEVADWPTDPPGVRRSRRTLKLVDKTLALTGGLVPGAYRVDQRLMQSLSQRRTETGIAFVGSRPGVVTDRLHGHILALLVGVPHAVLDNSYGKLRAFYDAWTHESPITYWAETPAQAAAWVLQRPVPLR